MDWSIREMRAEEYPLLNAFLYEAIFVPQGTEPPPREIVKRPELQAYVAGFGTRPGDCCLLAEADGRAVGAAWARIMDDYGHVDDETPSLAIALYGAYRGQGIGTALMKGLLALLRERGYERVSLSVQQANAAARLYRRLGFETVEERGEESIMVKNLQGGSCSVWKS